MDFHPLFVVFAIVYVRLYAITNIIIKQPRSVTVKEALYVTLTGLFLFGAYFLLFQISSPFFAALTRDTLVTSFLLLYLKKMKSYSTKKAFLLTMGIQLAVIFSNFLQILFFTPALMHLGVTLLIPPVLLMGLVVPVSYILHLLFAKLVTSSTEPFRRKINQSEGLQTALAYILPALVVLLAALLPILIPLGVTHTTEWSSYFGSSLHFLSFLALIETAPAFQTPILLTTVGVLILVAFAFILKSTKSQQLLRQKEFEQNLLHEYTKEIEKQYLALRRVGHDYQNILLSLDHFVKEEDWTGLKEYYTSHIKKTTHTVTEGNFALARLSKIKPKALKSILAAKLMMAHSLNVDVAVEVVAEIDHIPADLFTFIRMMGIIMDNAIEELEYLGGGKLMLACFRSGNLLTFIVQNTCRPDIPKLHQLKQPGFSTKGKGRGFGLDALSALADSQDIILETSIADGQFTQKLTISAEGRADNTQC